MEKCLVKLQTKFQEDPTVNEGWAAFLPRQLHVASSRSFTKRLPLEASLRGFLHKLCRGFFEKLSQAASLRS